MKLSEELKLWGYHSDISGKGREWHLEMAEKATQLEAENAELRKYAEHKADCAIRFVQPILNKCTCGLDALLTDE